MTNAYKYCLLCSLLFGLFSCASEPLHPSLKVNKAHHSKDGFQNLYIEDNDKGFFDYLKMRFLGDDDWADHAKLAHQVPVQEVDIYVLHNPSDDMQVTWLGHSMFVLQYQNLTILTDPIFTDRASPVSFAGPKRYVPHAMQYENLPNIDIVLISHNHYDHLDESTIAWLAERSPQYTHATRFYVPLGLRSILTDNGVSDEHIHEMDWWDIAEAEHYNVHALPSQHWSSRGTNDRRKTLWASWAIEIGERKIWFAGDTGYNHIQFKQIGQYLGKVDLAMIPIGAYEPSWFMQKYHVNPQEALLMHEDVNSGFSIGMHWGTFPLTAEQPFAPVIELERQRNKKELSQQDFDIMAIGESKRVKFN